nr:zinc finger, CCHC-type, retrotransposon Gag domain protein [Tanacetum cinerariifolium]
MCMSYSNVAQVANAARRGVVIGISRPLSRVVTGATVIITTVMDLTGVVAMTTTAAVITTTTLAVTTGIPVIDGTRETGVISPTDLPILRFLRLAGFLGAAAGTEEEQAKNFQWGLRRSTLNHLMCMSYTDVAQVANAARNYEILHEKDDDDTERQDKRQRSGDRHQQTSQQSSHRSHSHNNDRHGSDRRGGYDNHRSSNNNYSGSNNRNFGYGRDQRNKGQQSNRSANSGISS